MQFDMASIRVMLAMPTHRPLHPRTVIALLETQALCLQQGVPLEVSMQAGSSLVHHARSKCAALFLQEEFNRLFFVDSDIVWTGDDFFRLLAFSTKLDCVSAIYPAKQDEPLFFLRGVGKVTENELGCIPVDGLGLGFTVVTRRVIERLARLAPKRRFQGIEEPIASIFRCDSDGDEERGEDMAFFADVKAAGFQPWLDPHVTLGHVGAKVFRASVLDHLERKEDGEEIRNAA